MTAKTDKRQPIVTLTITPGAISPVARASGIKFWRKLITEAKKK